jgi:hypothetical protein
VGLEGAVEFSLAASNPLAQLIWALIAECVGFLRVRAGRFRRGPRERPYKRLPTSSDTRAMAKNSSAWSTYSPAVLVHQPQNPSIKCPD